MNCKKKKPLNELIKVYTRGSTIYLNEAYICTRCMSKPTERYR